MKSKFFNDVKLKLCVFSLSLLSLASFDASAQWSGRSNSGAKRLQDSIVEAAKQDWLMRKTQALIDAENWLRANNYSARTAGMNARVEDCFIRGDDDGKVAWTPESRSAILCRGYTVDLFWASGNPQAPRNWLFPFSFTQGTQVYMDRQLVAIEQFRPQLDAYCLAAHNYPAMGAGNIFALFCIHH